MIARTTDSGRNTRRRQAIFVVCLGAALLACSGNPAPLRPPPATPPARVSLCDAAGCRDTITLQFLGGAGVLLQERNRAPAVMTAPLFSNPRLSRTLVPFFPMRPNARRIAAGVHESDLSRVAALLVGHGHYDHLFDVTPIARDHAKQATVYGSGSVYNTLQGDTALARRAVNVDTFVGTATRAGSWTYVADRRWRIMPLASSHAPNFLSFTFSRGTERSPRSGLPRTSYGWKMGPPLAWLIDYMGDDTVPRFRIFYEDAASEPQFNQLPPLPSHDARRVDLAILCVGNWNKARDYPFALLRQIDPRHVLLGHWDDFFRDPRRPARVIALGHAKELADTLDVRPGRTNWTALLPRGRMLIAF